MIAPRRRPRPRPPTWSDAPLIGDPDGRSADEDLQAYVGGSTAANVDLAAEIASRLPLVIAVVLALSFMVLMIAFRSLLVPLQAAVDQPALPWPRRSA